MNTTIAQASSPSLMHVLRSTEIDEAEYERFLGRFSTTPGTVLAYHYPFYLRFLADTAYPGSARRFIIARGDAGEIRGVMPALHLKTSRLNLWLSLAYFGPNAGALAPGADTPDGAAVVRALLAAAQTDARELGCRSMTVYTPLNAAAEDYRAGLGQPDFEVERVAQCLALSAYPEQSPWPRKVRYDIRRAASLGVAVRPIGNERELGEVWDIYHRHCVDAGIPVKPLEHLLQLYRTAAAQGVFLLAEHGGEIVAGLVCFMGGGVLTYYLPCTRPQSRPLQAGLLLLDRAVACAKDAGCGLLNFEASPGVDGSVFLFKARCGGTPVSYRAFVKLLAPEALDEYRAMTPAGIAREAPHAFVVPFEALEPVADDAMSRQGRG